MPSLRVSVRISALVLGAGVALSMALACGGAADSGLFGSPSAVEGADASGNGNGNGADASTTPATDAGTTAPPPARDAATRDTGVDSAPPPVPDAGPRDPGIHCGIVTCDPATTICCRSIGFTPAPIYTCTTEKACAQTNGFPIRCDSARDCANGGGNGDSVCCVTEDPQNGTATDVSCTQKNNCTDQTQTWLCDPAVAGSCPGGETCQPSTTTIPSYSICHP
jgi:hypothetical protein